MTSKDANENKKLVSEVIYTKNIIRGRDPNDNPKQGTILIEQFF